MTDGVRVGLIGLGAVGHHFATHLLTAYGRLTAHDIAPEAVARAADAGARTVASPREVATASDVVILSLPSPDAVEEVMRGEAGVLAGARAWALVIDTSTVGPETSRAIEAAARARGVDYLDAPITTAQAGGASTEGAAAGTATFLVGGTADAFARARPFLKLLGHSAHHLGPSGAGSVVKLITNHISGIELLIYAEAQAIASSAGVSAEALLDVVDDTIAKSYVLRELVDPRVRARDFEPGFSIDLMHKDHRLAGELARAGGVEAPFNDLALELWERMRAAGRGGKDHVEAVNFIAEMAGVDIHDPSGKGGSS